MTLMKTVLVVCVLWSMTVTAVLAQSAQDQIISQLKDQNYSKIEVRRTFLGRIRITATGNGQEREIVLNPSTRTILRDHTVAERAQPASPAGVGRLPSSDRDDDGPRGVPEVMKERPAPPDGSPDPSRAPPGPPPDGGFNGGGNGGRPEPPPGVSGGPPDGRGPGGPPGGERGGNAPGRP